MSDDPAAGSDEFADDDYVRGQVSDALELTSYVVSNGIKTSDGLLLNLVDIGIIESTAASLGLITFKLKQARPAGGPVTTKQWNDFEAAYYRLAAVLHPVTAETLRDTADVAKPRAGGFIRQFLAKLRDRSPAQRFTVSLWGCTIFLALFVVFAEWGTNMLGVRPNQTDFWVKGPRDLLQSLQPWAYGGLGACAYMLRSAHYFIYQRSFDVRRTPEYFNRILLGAISGGAIILFVDNILNTDDGGGVHLGSAALGFVAGYSTDFLFNTIERIVTAIFPKVAVETVATDSSQARTAPKRKALDSKTDPQVPDSDDKDNTGGKKPRTRRSKVKSEAAGG